MKKKPSKRAPLARHIRYDRKGWITQLTIRPQEYKTLQAMHDGLSNTIVELAKELVKLDLAIET